MNVYPADGTPEITPEATAEAAAGISREEMIEAKAVIGHLPPRAAKMAAIEILLSDPESLDDDTLESALYILREKLRAS